MFSWGANEPSQDLQDPELLQLMRANQELKRLIDLQNERIQTIVDLFEKYLILLDNEIRFVHGRNVEELEKLHSQKEKKEKELNELETRFLNEYNHYSAA